MTRKGLYVLPLIAAVIAGFAFGRLRPASAPAAAHVVLYYVDPMHPSYRSNKPGIAPDCGMDLEPVYAEDAARMMPAASESPAAGRSIDAATQQLYGIRLEKVQMNSGQGTIRVFGRVAPDQTRVYRVNMGTDGFVKETMDDAVGNFVKKNQHLAVIYSPEFLAVVGGYLSANERGVSPGAGDRAATGGAKDPAPQSLNATSASARADRLRNLGMSEVQIEELRETRKIPEDVYVVSPTDGFILSRSVSAGMRFDRQSEFYSVADLSHVWIEAQVFGKDASAIRPGTMAKVTLSDTGEAFTARVSNVLPEVDPVTRTLKLRLEADNPKFALRPEMFVNVEIQVALPQGLTVPAEALLDSGLSKRVFVEAAEGKFESRDVETGWRLGDRVQVVKGLKEGEKVVAAGTFLVDSESRLEMAKNSAKPPDDPMHAGKSSEHGMD